MNHCFCFLGEPRLIESLDLTFPELRNAHLYTWQGCHVPATKQIDHVEYFSREHMYSLVQDQPNYRKFLENYNEEDTQTATIDRHLSQFYLCHQAAQRNLGKVLFKSRTDSLIGNHLNITSESLLPPEEIYDKKWQMAGSTALRENDQGIMYDSLIAFAPSYVEQMSDPQWINLVLDLFSQSYGDHYYRQGMAIWYRLSCRVAFAEHHQLFSSKIYPEHLENL
jgi:hypothetical protein